MNLIKAKNFIFNLAKEWLDLLAMLAAIMAVIASTAGNWLLGEWALSFTMLWLVICSVYLIFNLKINSIRFWNVFLGYIIFFSITYFSLFIDDSYSHYEGTKKLTFLSANVNTANTHYSEFIDSVNEVTPDVILVLEVNKRWIDELRVLEKDYSYNKYFPREDNFGIALFSKHPFSNERFISLSTRSGPAIITDIQYADKSISLLGLHTLPPTSPLLFRHRNIQIENAVKVLETRQTETKIIMGDLNSTPFSKGIKPIVDAGYRSGTAGFMPTWPKLYSLALIQIDHIFCKTTNESIRLSKDIKRIDIKGSDHFGVYAELKLNSDIIVTY